MTAYEGDIHLLQLYVIDLRNRLLKNGFSSRCVDFETKTYNLSSKISVFR